MHKLGTALTVSAATLILNIAPAFAQSTTFGSFMIADLGRDTVSLSKLNPTLPRMLNVVYVDVPQFQRDLGLYNNAKATVEVVLTATGSIVNASVSKSTGNQVLDRNALAAVNSVKFAPGTMAGSAVGGVYAISVDLGSEN